MTRPNLVQYTQIRPQTPKISTGTMFLSPFDSCSPRIPAQACSSKGKMGTWAVFGVKNRSKMTQPNLVQYTQIWPQTPKISARNMFLSPFDPRTPESQPRLGHLDWQTVRGCFQGQKSVKNDLTQFGPIHPNPASDTQNKYCKHVFEPV